MRELISSIRGGLVTDSFARSPRFADGEPRALSAGALRHLLQIVWSSTHTLGPASSVRSIADLQVVPLLRWLGYRLTRRVDTSMGTDVVAYAGERPVAVSVRPWGTSPAGVRRDAIARGIAEDARWALIFNGAVIHLLDTTRPWSRRYLEVDVPLLLSSEHVRELLWTVLHADALTGSRPLLDRTVWDSARYVVTLRSSLARGVLTALNDLVVEMAASGARASSSALLEQSLTVLYRLLFLLFAEARGLVPMWHPVYRDRYTIGSMLEAILAGRPVRGIWAAVQAISRLAHSGCQAGDLRVTAFNGRLFSPLRAPLAERGRVRDDAMTRVLLALGASEGLEQGLHRIDYHDLDVEQLGAVYERVLDFEVVTPRDGPGMALVQRGDARKVSSTFYTPRTITERLVEETLTPLVSSASSATILSLRIVDPAMGSGAFLVAACRFLADALERALIREGSWHEGDATPMDRARLRRTVAQRCLYGVDLNPMAVQLARLSLWLITMSRDRPLTFLDHHLAVGDSVLGTSWRHVRDRPGGTRSKRAARLPLFDEPAALEEAMRVAVPLRLRLGTEPDDSASIVRRKEALLETLHDELRTTRWRAAFDLWCACWFWPDSAPPTTSLYGALVTELLHGQRALPSAVTRPWLDQAARTARACRFFHWELQFPEVFFDEHGHVDRDGGFDAVIGNPPWDMVRADTGDTQVRAERRRRTAQIVRFVRESGVYVATGEAAHANRYQLFLERALHLARPHGRIGLVVPSGLLSDGGAAPVRRLLFERADVDRVSTLDNRSRLFPVHRSVRFSLLSATTGSATRQFRYRVGVPIRREEPEPELDTEQGAHELTLTLSLLERISGKDDLGVPAFASDLDLAIVERISAMVPPLRSRDGWGAAFGRELNATDDRNVFTPVTHRPVVRPVLEGKQIEPFRARVDRCRFQLTEGAAATRPMGRHRLAVREVASATNRLTVIAAIVPASAVTTHTASVLRTPLSAPRQLVLCALLNSYVANYLARLRVSTHVSVRLLSRLPVPCPAHHTARQLAVLAARLANGAADVEDMDEHATLQALCAMLYGLDASAFAHVLDGFPLVADAVRHRCAEQFEAMVRRRRLGAI